MLQKSEVRIQKPEEKENKLSLKPYILSSGF